MSKDGVVQCITSIVYAQNQLEVRKRLWEELIELSHGINVPWIAIGDFNNILEPHDRLGGAQQVNMK